MHIDYHGSGICNTAAMSCKPGRVESSPGHHAATVLSDPMWSRGQEIHSPSTWQSANPPHTDRAHPSVSVVLSLPGEFVRFNMGVRGGGRALESGPNVFLAFLSFFI